MRFKTAAHLRICFSSLALGRTLSLNQKPSVLLCISLCKISFVFMRVCVSAFGTSFVCCVERRLIVLRLNAMSSSSLSTNSLVLVCLFSIKFVLVHHMRGKKENPGVDVKIIRMSWPWGENSVGSLAILFSSKFSSLEPRENSRPWESAVLTTPLSSGLGIGELQLRPQSCP